MEASQEYRYNRLTWEEKKAATKRGFPLIRNHRGNEPIVKNAIIMSEEWAGVYSEQATGFMGRSFLGGVLN